MGKNEIFPKLMSTIFYDEYMKINHNDFREVLLKNIISKDDFIYNCFPLLKKIIKNIGLSIEPKKIDDNFSLIEGENNRMIRYLNKIKSNTLDQIILQIFEHILLEYFENISADINKDDKKHFERYFKEKKEIQDNQKNQKNTKDKYKKYILFDLSLIILESCINILNVYVSKQNSSDSETKNYNNLYKLYAIAYIKTYFTKFIEFVDQYDDYDIQIILNKLQEDNNLMKVIKIYILKIFYNSINNSVNRWNYFLTRNFTKKEHFNNIINDNDNSESVEDSFFLINYFMPSNKEDQNIFKNYTNNFINIIAEKKEISQNNNENEIKNIDIFLMVAINKIISNLFLDSYLDFGMHYRYYINLCEYFDKIYHNLNKNLKKLLKLFLNKDNLAKLKEIFEKQKSELNIKGEPYESLLYGLRFCVQTLLKLK